MAKKGFRVTKEIKDEILSKIKNDGISVMDAANQYDIQLAGN
jgi:hypothetical protein